jgi:hypothetical protein
MFCNIAPPICYHCLFVDECLNLLFALRSRKESVSYMSGMICITLGLPLWVFHLQLVCRVGPHPVMRAHVLLIKSQAL